MTLLLIVAVSLCISAGVLLILSRDAFRIVVGFAVLGSGVNLIVFLAVRPLNMVPPVIPRGLESMAEGATGPLPQALVLTAIVISFALLCLSLVLAARVSRDHGHSDVSKQQASEPSTGPSTEDSLKPPIMERES